MATSEDIERKVRALLERANHPETPQAEAETALAMAYRLMLKYDLDESRVHTSRAHTDQKIEQRRYETVGPYRVRRDHLRYRIGEVLSCASYRDRLAGDSDVVVSHVFGTATDLDALEVLFAAAEILALRMIPWGDRGFRTSWWHGFTDGIEEALTAERRTVERSDRGVALVLRDRHDRATVTMHDLVPGLTKGRSIGATWAGAYEDGLRAGATFSGGSRSVSGSTRALPRGT